jgi:thioredoxin 1
MAVIDITTKAQFDELVKTTPYVALQAHATWCGPCKAISPIFSKQADNLAIPDKYTFARFDTDDVSDLAMELGIRSIPAFFFFENGDKVDSLTGANPPALQKLTQGIAEKAKKDGEVSSRRSSLL